MEQQQTQQAQPAQPASQKLPAGLAGVLNAPSENRDSAYFSSTDASSSKRPWLKPLSDSALLLPPTELGTLTSTFLRHLDRIMHWR